MIFKSHYYLHVLLGKILKQLSKFIKKSNFDDENQLLTY